MKLTEVIAQHIIAVHQGENWTDVNIYDTLSDVDIKEATTITKASKNSIAALVHHIRFYNDVVLERLSGIYPAINEANGFDVPAINTEDDWMQLKQGIIQSAYNLAAAVSAFDEKSIFNLTVTGEETYYKMLHGISEHAHYHLGQIVLIKKLIRQVKDAAADASR
jgi:uncharacterized damage-inducible protein DinB